MPSSLPEVGIGIVQHFLCILICFPGSGSELGLYKKSVIFNLININPRPIWGGFGVAAVRVKKGSGGCAAMCGGRCSFL